jgi:hypothetical protein
MPAAGLVHEPTRCRSARQATAAVTDAVATAKIASSHGELRSVPLPIPCAVAAVHTTRLR